MLPPIRFGGPDSQASNSHKRELAGQEAILPKEATKMTTDERPPLNSRGSLLTAEESILTEKGEGKTYHQLTPAEQKGLDAFIKGQTQLSIEDQTQQRRAGISPIGRQLEIELLKPYLERMLQSKPEALQRKTPEDLWDVEQPYDANAAKKLAKDHNDGVVNRFVKQHNDKIKAFEDENVAEKPTLTPTEEALEHILHGYTEVPLSTPNTLVLNAALKNNHPLLFHRALNTLRNSNSSNFADPAEKAKNKALLNKKDFSGATAFFTAVMTRRFRTAAELLTEGANPFIPNKEGQTDKEGQTAFDMLAEQGETKGQTAFDMLAEQGETKKLGALWEATRPEFKETYARQFEQLHKTAEANRTEITKLTEDYRLLTPEDKEDGLWARIYSAAADRLEIRALIQAGAVINTTDYDGDTLLHRAVVCRRKDIVNTLIQAGANIEAAKDKDGETPLHQAADSGQEDIVNALIQAGANINIADKNGETPLHYAAASGNKAAVQALLQANADVNARDHLDMTPFQYAELEKHYDVAEFLKQRMDPKALPRQGFTVLSPTTEAP
jgi:ankyrin repeat protein